LKPDVSKFLTVLRQKDIAMAYRKEVTRHKENPFINASSIATRKKRVTVKGGKAVVDLETGEMEDVAEIVMVRSVDTEQFVKLFTQNLRVFFDLTSPTMKLLQVLLAQVQRTPNSDRVMLSMPIMLDYFTESSLPALSKASFHRAVKELLTKQFIAATALPGLFFINPNLFFNGDRVRFVNELKRKRGDADQAQLARSMESGEFDARHSALIDGRPAVLLESESSSTE